MEPLIALAASVLFALACRNTIKARPIVFYAAAAIVATLFASHAFGSFAPMLDRALQPYVQRCLLAFGMFAVVMFIGVLPDDSKPRRYLTPIRGELSIIAAILACGHVVGYGASYLRYVPGNLGGMPATMIASFAVSAMLVVLLAPLTLTSFKSLRKRVDAQRWKRVQMLAYPFFFLIYLHLLLILAPSASGAGQKAFGSIVVYTGIIGCYAILRAAKAISSQRRLARSDAG